jgi:hypothetical protein
MRNYVDIVSANIFKTCLCWTYFSKLIIQLTFINFAICLDTIQVYTRFNISLLLINISVIVSWNVHLFLNWTFCTTGHFLYAILINNNTKRNKIYRHLDSKPNKLYTWKVANLATSVQAKSGKLYNKKFQI